MCDSINNIIYILFKKRKMSYNYLMEAIEMIGCGVVCIILLVLSIKFLDDGGVDD